MPFWCYASSCYWCMQSWNGHTAFCVWQLQKNWACHQQACFAILLNAWGSERSVQSGFHIGWMMINLLSMCCGSSPIFNIGKGETGSLMAFWGWMSYGWIHLILNWRSKVLSCRLYDTVRALWKWCMSCSLPVRGCDWPPHAILYYLIMACIKVKFSPCLSRYHAMKMYQAFCSIISRQCVRITRMWHHFPPGQRSTHLLTCPKHASYLGLGGSSTHFLLYRPFVRWLLFVCSCERATLG